VILLISFLVVLGVFATLFDSGVGAVFALLGFVALVTAGFSAATKDGWKWFIIAGGKPTRSLSKLEKRLVLTGLGMMGSVLATILGQMVFETR